MATFTVWSWRDAQHGVTGSDLRQLAARLAPLDSSAPPPHIVTDHGLAVCLSDPTPVSPSSTRAVSVGRLFDGESWDRCGSPPPDGSYAVARFAPGEVEILTDAVASRTIWYVKTSEFFGASTSQRALVMLLGDFHPNASATAWMLTSGNLGPEASWDARLRRMPPNTVVTLDRSTWRLRLKQDEIGFDGQASATTGVETLREAIVDACRRMRLADPGFALPLSGGLDSRTILLSMTAAGMRPLCVTWGPARDQEDPKSDVFVARRLARTLGLEHRFYPVEPAPQFSTVLQRFVALSEGTVEDITGYSDGMALYESLRSAGVRAIVRGDEPSFGEYYVYKTERQARVRENALLADDYPQSHPLRRLALGDQVWPTELRRRPSEELEDYSARVYEQHFITAALAPLNHLKSAYVEIANPLLSRSVTVAAHALPPSLRRGRGSLREIVSRYGPQVPLAVRHSPPVPRGFLELPPVAAELERTLRSDTASALFPEEPLRVLREAMVTAEPRAYTALKAKAREVAPKQLLELLHPVPEVELSSRRLAFRACLAIRAHDLLAADATALATRSGNR